MCINTEKEYIDFVQYRHFVLSVLRVLGIYSESWAIQSLNKKGAKYPAPACVRVNLHE